MDLLQCSAAGRSTKPASLARAGRNSSPQRGLETGPDGLTGWDIRIWPGGRILGIRGENVAMKLLRHGPSGQERPGILDAEGKIRDLSGKIDDIDGDKLSPAKLKELAAIDISSLPVVEGNPRLGVPVARIGKFIAVGLNFSDHAAESGLPVPAEPVVFTKAISSITGPNDNVIIPRGSKKTDWEVELGVVIGTRASYVTKDEALAHVAGYVVINDVSEREYQIERGGTWDKGKGCDTFGPIGPWLVTSDEVGRRAEPVDVAGCQRRAQADRHDRHDDLRRGDPGQLHQRVHDPDARRRHHDRHPARRRHGHQAAAAIPEGRRRCPPGHREAGRAAADLRRVGENR